MLRPAERERIALGFAVTLYAFLITFWGTGWLLYSESHPVLTILAAWVLFLIGWIHVGDRQDYFIEICDQILTAREFALSCYTELSDVLHSLLRGRK